MTGDRDTVAALLAALRFASDKHKTQARKGAGGEPYVNHVIQVTELMARVGGVTDVGALQAALLHDTIEDTDATGDEIERRFGPAVRSIVEEVSDDKSLPKTERKRLQIERAPALSAAAQAIKIADKTCNVFDVTHAPPADWSLERRLDYLEWADRVVEGCRGCNSALEEHYDRVIAECRIVLAEVAYEDGE